ncbi:hypothetical protein PAENIP36_54070 [Paenibacillus sp. P36]
MAIEVSAIEVLAIEVITLTYLIDRIYFFREYKGETEKIER